MIKCVRILHDDIMSLCYSIDALTTAMQHLPCCPISYNLSADNRGRTAL